MSEARKKRGEGDRVLDALRCALTSKSGVRNNTVPCRTCGERVEPTGAKTALKVKTYVLTKTASSHAQHHQEA